MTTFFGICKGLIHSFVSTTPALSPPNQEMDVDNPGNNQGLFAQCSFAIVRSANLTNAEAESVCYPKQFNSV